MNPAARKGALEFMDCRGSFYGSSDAPRAPSAWGATKNWTPGRVEAVTRHKAALG